MAATRSLRGVEIALGDATTLSDAELESYQHEISARLEEARETNVQRHLGVAATLLRRARFEALMRSGSTWQEVEVALKEDSIDDDLEALLSSTE